MKATDEARPKYVQDLEAAFGPPSDSGFGSAVFFARVKDSDDLEQSALKVYQSFVGDTWERWGEAVWLAVWREVYARPTNVEPDIIGELGAIEDRDAAISVPLLLGVVETSDAAGRALTASYDAPDVTDVRVFRLGDGDMMSGLLVAGRRDSGDTVFLTLLMD